MVHPISFTLEHSWEVVVLAYETKFHNIPNPELPDILEIKFLNCKRDGETGVITVERWGRFALSVPTWMIKLAGGPDCLIMTGESIIDRKARKLTSTGRNITFRDKVWMDEVTTITPHPDDPKNKTLLHMEPKIEIKIRLLGMSGAAIRILFSVYKRVTNKARVVEKPMIKRLEDSLTGKMIPFTPSEARALKQDYDEAAKLADAADAALKALPKDSDEKEKAKLEKDAKDKRKAAVTLLELVTRAKGDKDAEKALKEPEKPAGEAAVDGAAGGGGGGGGGGGSGAATPAVAT